MFLRGFCNYNRPEQAAIDPFSAALRGVPEFVNTCRECPIKSDVDRVFHQ